YFGRMTIKHAARGIPDSRDDRFYHRLLQRSHEELVRSAIAVLDPASMDTDALVPLSTARCQGDLDRYESAKRHAYEKLRAAVVQAMLLAPTQRDPIQTHGGRSRARKGAGGISVADGAV